MASWVALNVEPDESIEDEVDDTKELQIEEALKLYHNALKLHSQGPDFYPQAAEAYEALLKSDIFQYPESISDFKRAALPESQSATLTDEHQADAVTGYNVSDSTSSLFQTLYLSYKNHGKYILDSLRETLQNAPHDPESVQKSRRATVESSQQALESFADALERDDTDLNLWRQSARLSSALQSYRLNRFCLESVLADDENRLDARAEQLGLEEIFSEERLRGTLKSLFDELSASQVPVKKPKKALVKYLQRHVDLYPYLPSLPTDLEALDRSKGPLSISLSCREITPSEATWESVGKAILKALDDEDNEPVAAGPTRSIQLRLPSRDSEMSDAASPQIDDPGISNNITEEEEKVDYGSTDKPPEDESLKPTNPATKLSKEQWEMIEEQSSIDQSAEQQLMQSLEGQSTQPFGIDTAELEVNPEEIEPKSPSGARKRSSASLANEEQPEGGRLKSRRTRARESNVEALIQPEEIIFDQGKYYEDRLEVFVNADEWMFHTAGSLFSRIGIEALGSINSLREKTRLINESDDTPGDVECRLCQDLRGVLKNWNEEKSRLMQQKDDLALKDIRGTSKSGLTIFLEHSRRSTRKLPFREKLLCHDELYVFSKSINDQWLSPHDTSYEWLKWLLTPDFGVPLSQPCPMKSAYASYLWSDELKQTVVNLLLREDEFIYTRLSGLLFDMEQRLLESSTGAAFEYQSRYFSEFEMIQTIYELHLDIFASVENLSSHDKEQSLRQRDRLARWEILARSSLEHFLEYCPSQECRQNLALRHLWASAFHVNLAGEAQREHVLLCLQDLKDILQSLGDPTVCLINNPIMSEISVATIDQEVLKLKCMDFFTKIFNPEDEDPVSLIESIEPILEPSSVESPEYSSVERNASHHLSLSSEMASFLDRGDATLRLFLWRRLQEAYQTIDYPPKVISCYLRSIETVLNELENDKNAEELGERRETRLLSWLKSLDSIMGKAIPLVLQQSEAAFECLDTEHLQCSMSAISRLIRLLHSFVLYEDSVRVGRISGREFRGGLAKTLENFKERMRELYVRCWILQYTLFLEGISQNRGLFEDPLEDRIHLLRSVHNALGVRSMCRYSQKRFLKLLKSELFCLETKGDYEFDVCQVLFDLHGIKFSPSDGTIDHGCSPEKLDRFTATMMIDFVMKQAHRMNMKDLSKSELKTTIEKMQQAIGPAKLPSQSPQMSFNRRIFSAYIKNPINPSALLRAVQGVSELSMTKVPGENAKIAAKGWYFLLGHATLTKFRSQKRLSPGSTAELDDAINFFRQDLDHGTGRWETWYRLAQAYDTKLEEDITWAADKINNNRGDLAATQRYAIHCYAMAVSTAIRNAEPTVETRALLSDLYTDFGIRLYSSSREPLSMGAFSLADFPRHFSSEQSQQMYKGQPFKEMSLYSVWNFAGNLLRRALVDKPKRWMAHYYLSKCLWKMFCYDSMRTTSTRIEVSDVVDALTDAIAALPQRKDSRADPIFEPHFKLLSVVHKSVLKGVMTPAEGSKTLQATPWARKVDAPLNVDGWKPYILEVIKKFKSADKSNWHHRMSAKGAHIIYDDQRNTQAAVSAKQEMSQIFTKTLTIQVWRPEHERPGRHFVYTTRYVYFFASLLDQLDDRPSMDQLLRRVRKKQGDFIKHTQLWEDLCLTYAKIIRRAAHIKEGHEESIFRPIGWEEFSTKTARLENLETLSAESPPLLELIRDSLELKKLNNNLMKVTMFEDLIADLYARVYELNMPQLLEQANEENKEKMKVDHLLMTGDVPPTETSTPSNSLPASDTPAPRGRTKGIARRDIQKRADTIVNLKLGPRTAVNRFAVTTETDQPSATPRSSNLGVASGRVSALSEANQQVSSVDNNIGSQKDDPNSIHDTGDESELSEANGGKLDDMSIERRSVPSHLTRTEQPEGETEDDDAGSGDENVDEEPGEGEEVEGDEDEGDNYDEAEGDVGDAGATEVETVGEEVQDADTEDYEMQDADAEAPAAEDENAGSEHDDND